MTVDELEVQLETLEEAIEDLRAEQKLLPAQLGRAVSSVDAAAIDAAQSAMAAMPGRLFLAEIERLKTVMEMATAQEAQRIAERDALVEVARPLQSQIADLQKQLVPTLARLQTIANNERRYRDKRLDAKLKLERLTYDRQVELGTAGAPVVRALNYA